MVFIAGSNNGQIGFGMTRALFPKNMGNIFGMQGNPLPSSFPHSSTVQGRSYLYGKKRKTRKKSKKSRKRSKTRAKHQ